MVKIRRRTTRKHGCESRRDLCPASHVVVDTYHPSPTVTPYDCYGRSHQSEYQWAMERAGLAPIRLTEDRRILNPMGSGRGGAVRFGDDMTPGVYRLAVPKGQRLAALHVIALHRLAVRAWLFCGGPRPEAIGK